MNKIITFRSLNGCNKIITREYAFKSDLKIKWVRPEKIPCHLPEKSGDSSPLPKIDTKDILPDFRESRELQTADEKVKALFRLENNPSRLVSQLHRQSFVREVQRHSLDYGSMEAKVAGMTSRIRYLQEVVQNGPKNTKVTVFLKELIDKRKKYLKFLRRWDYKRFEWLLEKLDLVYKSPPPKFHWITRKDSLRKLTNAHCEKIKDDRLSEYRKVLQSEQIGFLEKKVENLKFIRNEQIECKVPVTITDQEIKQVEKQLEELKLQEQATDAKDNE